MMDQITARNIMITKGVPPRQTEDVATTINHKPAPVDCRHEHCALARCDQASACAFPAHCVSTREGTE